MSAIAWAHKTVNSGLRPLGVQVVRGRSADSAVQSFIPARKTIAAARRAGQSVGDYLDQTFAEPGVTSATVEALLRIAELTGPLDRVCEIGPGSGRFAEKIIEAQHPTAYEIYETADDWVRRLRTLPSVVVRPCDGRTLAGTATASVDLVHAQKVFVYLEAGVTAGYLDEMARVTRPGGVAAFDVVTENCMDEATVAQWRQHGTIFRPIPRGWVLEFLDRRGLTHLGDHFALMPPGRSELMVFRRR